MIAKRQKMVCSKAGGQIEISWQHLPSAETPGVHCGISLELIYNIATVLEIEPYLLFKFKLEK